MEQRQYVVHDWKQQYKIASASNWKEHIYKFTRPWLSLIERQKLCRETLNQLNPEFVLGVRGFPLNARRQWALKNLEISDKTILVQGTGNGWDVYSWALYRPRKIIGVDLFEFESWNGVRKQVANDFGVDVQIHAASLSELSFVDDESVDICVSDSVYEHLTDLRAVLLETHRVLRRNGLIYASYGPLWYSAGGDHFSGRGGLLNSFNHLLLSDEEYQQYFRQMGFDQEDFQSGGRYVLLDLFSKLRTAEYLDLYEESGFRIDSLIIEVSKKAWLFQKQYPLMFQKLLSLYPDCTRDDFLITSNIVRLQKQSTQGLE